MYAESTASSIQHFKLGYSYGAVTAKAAASKLWKARNASENNPVNVCDYEIKCPLKVKTLVTLDTVTFMNPVHNKKKTSNRWVNYYQDKKGNYAVTYKDTGQKKWYGSFLSRMLKGKSFKNADIDESANKDFKGIVRDTVHAGRAATIDGSDVNHDVVPMYFSTESINELNK